MHDMLLKSFLKYVKSFTRYYLDMLNHLPAKLNEVTLLGSFDMGNIYTNISHEYSIEAIAFSLEKYSRDARTNQPQLYNHSS